MRTEWGGNRARKIQRAYDMLRIPMAPDMREWSELDLSLRDIADPLEHAFGDAVAHLLLAAEQAGQDSRRLCEEQLEYVADVRSWVVKGLRDLDVSGNGRTGEA